MQIFSLVILVLLMTLTQVAFGDVIYGDDHRKEVSQGTRLQKKAAKSAASMIPKESISENLGKKGFYILNQKSLRAQLETSSKENKISTILSNEVRDSADKGINYCEEERFVDQPAPSMCSGFLIAHDLLVTAGHCVENPNSCSNFKWVFDFKVDRKKNTAGLNIKEEDIYSCKKVVSHLLNMDVMLDYAIVQLDRSVTGRVPLEVRTKEKTEDQAPLFVIGSPSGLPLKIASSANVRFNDHPFYFSANLDTFQGNSGSGVFNAITGTIEGILVRGEEDFVLNKEKLCIEAKKCQDDSCQGEEVSRILSVPEIGLHRALIRATESENMVNLEKILSLNIWIDFYTKDGQSALMKAVLAGKINSAKALIAKGANVNLKNVDGNTAIHLMSSKLNTDSEDILKLLLRSGAKIEEKNNLQETPLQKAAKELNLTSVKILISNGADRNVLDAKGESILFPFARAGRVDAISELSILGLDISLKNNKGKTIEKYISPWKGILKLKKSKKKAN